MGAEVEMRRPKLGSYEYQHPGTSRKFNGVDFDHAYRGTKAEVDREAKRLKEHGHHIRRTRTVTKNGVRWDLWSD